MADFNKVLNILDSTLLNKINLVSDKVTIADLYLA